MAYEWIGAAAAGTASAIAGMAQHPSKARRYAKELAAYNTQLANEQYEKYASPAAQMRQYKEAGLNPNLIYGQQIANTPQAGQVEYDESHLPNTGKAVAGIADGIQAYYNAMSMQQQVTNAKLAQDAAAIDIDAKKADADFTKQMNAYKLEDKLLDIRRKKYKADFQDVADLQLTYQKIDDMISKAESRGIKDKIAYEQLTQLREAREMIGVKLKILKAQLKGMELENQFQEETYDSRKLGLSLDNMTAKARNQILGYQGKMLGLNYDNLPKDIMARNWKNWYSLYGMSQQSQLNYFDNMVNGYLKKIMEKLPFTPKGVGRSIMDALGTSDTYADPTSNAYWDNLWNFSY